MFLQKIKSKSVFYLWCMVLYFVFITPVSAQTSSTKSEKPSFVVGEPKKKSAQTLDEVLQSNAHVDHEKGEPFYYFYPFVPRKTEWNIELGSMWEENTMYWVALMYGKNIGTCLLTQSQSCQQYADIIGGVGGRDGYTNGIVMPSLRWQFVNFPDTFSPSARVFVGMMNILDDKRDKENLVYGLGLGVTRTVHKNIDLKVEFRLGGGDHTWSQVFVSFGVRVGAFIQFFAEKMGDLGVETVKTTGKVIQKSGEIGVDVLKKSGEVGVDVLKKPVELIQEKKED